MAKVNNPIDISIAFFDFSQIFIHICDFFVITFAQMTYIRSCTLKLYCLVAGESDTCVCVCV